MTRVVCVSANQLPDELLPDVDYFTVYRSSGNECVSTVGTGLLYDIDKNGLCPPVTAWDFTTFALAVSAADQAAARSRSPDGWTRVMELSVALANPAPFQAVRTSLESMLRYLTGDFWTLSFLDGGEPAPRSTAPVRYEADCVSLLSGGIDSLVGGIDLSSRGARPLFVSQMAKGDSETQVHYANQLGGAQRHLQWNHNIRVMHPTERSTRARSVVFFAFALLAAGELHAQSGETVQVYVPENGFISLNVPLNPGRAGSLSTKTTHPVFLARLQEVLAALGLPVLLGRPYAFKTKGELMAECADRGQLTRLVGRSTSCGRYGYYNYTHCGRCVPCLVRRASFLAAGLTDTTRTYHFSVLRSAGRNSGANDIGAVAAAVLRMERDGPRSLTAGQLSFAAPTDRAAYEGVVVRGLQELGSLLRSQGVL
jgi:hypothetical protein